MTLISTPASSRWTAEVCRKACGNKPPWVLPKALHFSKAVFRFTIFEFLRHLVEVGLRFLFELCGGEQRGHHRFDLRKVFAKVGLRIESLMMAPRASPAASAFRTVLVGSIIELQRTNLRKEIARIICEVLPARLPASLRERGAKGIKRAAAVVYKRPPWRRAHYSIAAACNQDAVCRQP